MDKNEVADTVRRAADGDRAAWERIVEDFGGLLWAVCRGYRLDRADAAEVVQTTWLRLLENLDRIREPEHLGGWLSTTARREALRLHRLHGRELATDDDTTFDRDVDRDPLGSVVDPAAAALAGDRDRRLWRAFAELPERCRRLLRLLMVTGPSYVEVAAALDMPIGSIGPTRARCLDRLRRLLVEQDPSGLAEAW